MKELKALKELAIHAVRGTTPEPTADFNCSIEDVESTLRDELRNMASDYNAYRKNKYDIFEIMQAAADEYLPNRIIAAMGAFAEVNTYRDGAKIEFRVRKGKLRGKKFVTKATPSGVYEAFRLDSDVISLDTVAVGGATTIDFNRYLCGEEDMAENMAALYEGIEDAVYKMVQDALIATVSGKSGKAANYAIVDGFEADAMVQLINTVRAYGTGAVIYATREFIAAMGADIIVTGASPKVSSKDLDEIRDTGIVQVFRGCPVIELPQSFADESNSEKVINPAYAYVFPTGGEKVVKVAFEGDTRVDDFKNRDLSYEIQAYKKIGVGILHTNNWAVYHNTALDA